MVELPDDVGQAARVAYDRLWNEGAQESSCLEAALLAAYPLIAARVRAEALREAAEKIVPNRVRPSNVIIVGARITEDVLSMVRTVEDALVRAVRAEAVAEHLRRIEAVLNASDLFAADAPHNGAAWQLRADLLESRAP